MLYLREPLKEDEREICDCYERSVSLHEPWVFKPKDYSLYLQQENRYFLCLEEPKSIVGTFHISNIVRGCFQSAYLGFEAFVPYGGKGYMTQGVKLLLDKAFVELNLHRLEANVQPENTRSIQLLSRSGFIKEGFSRNYLNIGGRRWCDHERWAIVNDAWQE